MATLSGTDSVALDTRALVLTDILNGTYQSSSSTTADYDLGGGNIGHLIGTGFTFDPSHNPGAGTITEISIEHSGVTQFRITGLSLNLLQFQGWSNTHDNASAMQAVFGGNDNMVGTSQGDYLDGGDGHDYISGENGADTLIGGAGNDHLYGFASLPAGPDGADSLSGGDGNDYLQGNKGDDTLDGGNGSDRINGGGDNDHILGGQGNDTVNGNLGNDSIDGGDGNDSLRGGQDDDTIDGGNGDDVISGDKGFDVLTGGAGHDIFQFAAGDALISGNNTDVISDFTAGTDHLKLAFLPVALLQGGSAASFAAAQTSAQTTLDGHAGDHEVAAFQVGTETYLFWNGTGGATVDSALHLHNVTATAVTLTDFI